MKPNSVKMKKGPRDYKKINMYSGQTGQSKNPRSFYNSMYKVSFGGKSKSRRRHHVKRKVRSVQSRTEQVKNEVALIDKPFKKQRFMIFTPFELDFNYLLDRAPPADNGYYFTFVTYENRFVKSFFHYNGFVETDNAKATLIWNCGVVKTEIYQQMSPY